MTTRSGSVAPSNQSDAYFRAWGKWISDSFSAFGWVQAADTGQANWTTVLAPTTTWTSQCYEIWRMADSLQATYPVFVKIEYGSAGTVGYPWMRLTIGTGSDGSGNLTGVIFNGHQIYYGGTATAQPCFASGASSRIAFQLFRASSYHIFFSIERTHNADGSDSNVGVMVFTQHLASTFTSQQCNFTGTSPTRHSYWNAGAIPQAGTGAVAPDIHFFPVRCWTPGESFPSQNVISYHASDCADLSTYSVVGYDGVARTYMAFNQSYPGNINGTTWFGRHMMRWD